MHDTRYMCIIRSMATVAIVGASGYAGQETLDRVLAHPALELYALGSDSLAGEPAGTLDPRLEPERLEPHPSLHHERGGPRGRRGRHVPLPVAPRRRPRSRCLHAESCRPLRRASLPRSERVRRTGTAFGIRAPDALSSWSYGLPELERALGPPGREPRLLRDRRAARARADRGPRSSRPGWWSTRSRG